MWEESIHWKLLCLSNHNDGKGAAIQKPLKNQVLHYLYYCKCQHLGGSRTMSLRLTQTYDMVGPCLSGGEKGGRGRESHMSFKELANTFPKLQSRNTEAKLTHLHWPRGSFYLTSCPVLETEAEESFMHVFEHFFQFPQIISQSFPDSYNCQVSSFLCWLNCSKLKKKLTFYFFKKNEAFDISGC